MQTLAHVMTIVMEDIIDSRWSEVVVNCEIAVRFTRDNLYRELNETLSVTCLHIDS